MSTSLIASLLGNRGIAASTHATRNLGHPDQHVETLEPRQMLAGDLTAAFVGELPISVVGGARGTATIRVLNVGFEAAVARNPSVQLFASTDDVLSSDDRLLASRQVPTLNLRPGRSASARLQFSYPTDMPEGAYRLLAIADPENLTNDSDQRNNTAVSVRAVTIAGPFVDLRVIPSGSTGGVLAVNRGTIKSSFTIVNDGNIKLTGRADIRFVASSDGVLSDDDVELRTLANQSLSLAPGKSRKVTLSNKAPPTLWNGGFNILCIVDSRSQVVERLENNNVIASTGRITITGSQTPEPITGVIGFVATPGRAVAGSTEQAFFYVTTRGLEAESVIKLYDADAQGNPDYSRFLVDVADNGSSVYGDAQAGDGIYTNTFAINIAAPGRRYFAAVEQATQRRTSTFVEAVVAPSQQRLTELSNFTSSLTTNYMSSMRSGATSAAALSSVVASLQANPLVDSSTIQRTVTNVSWASTEGFIGSVISTAESTTERGGTDGRSNDDDGIDDTQPDGNPNTNDFISLAQPVVTGGDCKRAITIAPYAAEFEPSDESDNIAASLTTAGYSVTSRANGQVLIEDFKNLGQYDAVVISSHGARLNGTGVIILTGVQVTPARTVTYVSDLTSGRMGMNGNT